MTAPTISNVKVRMTNEPELKMICPRCFGSMDWYAVAEDEHDAEIFYDWYECPCGRRACDTNHPLRYNHETEEFEEATSQPDNRPQPGQLALPGFGAKDVR